MKYIVLGLPLLLSACGLKEPAETSTADVSFQWGQLPALPDPIGFAGAFAGVSGGAMLVGGGANFPDGGAPWTGSRKKWYDKVFVLENGGSTWKEAGKLPRPLGYGVSASWRDGVVCVGGSNESGHYADAFILHYHNGQLEREPLPSMPAPLANACGAISGDTLYVAGGTTAPDAKSSENVFWALDLSAQGAARKWTALPPWPGPSRLLAVAGTQRGLFYLFSGALLKEGKRTYLKDAYRYDPSRGWSRISDLPSAVVAAPSPAYSDGKGRLFLFGGDDGRLADRAAQLKDQHPGFSTAILAFDTDSGKWGVAGTVLTDKKENAAVQPNESVWAPVTTTLVDWNGRVVLPGGEVRPATRTPRVLTASIKTP